MKLPLILFFLLSSFLSSAQTGSDARIRTYELAYVTCLESDGLTSEAGFQINKMRSLPFFLKKHPNKNGLPYFYTNFGLQYTFSSMSNGGGGDTGSPLVKFNFHSIQVPLQLEYKIFSMRGGGQIRSLFYSLFAAHAGINVGYQTVSDGSTSTAILVEATPFQATFCAGLKTYKNMHGFSFNLNYNKDLMPTFVESDFKKAYLTFGIAWNRLDSECETSKRRTKGFMKELRGGS
ncbi:MAG: hypothetical protein COB65_12245 [Thalassobium sp.]|nr:MAG: hypothetical protein COB65_12245 [Thalassobium sp.]